MKPAPRVHPLDLAYAGFVLVCLLAVTSPGYSLVAERLEPRLMGLPPTFVWNIAWVVASFFALLGYHLARGGRR